MITSIQAALRAQLHQTQRELLDMHGPFESIEALQAAADTWRQEYNTDRPRNSFGDGIRGQPVYGRVLPLECASRPS